MAPQVSVSLEAACTRAIEGRLESQDSQTIAIIMHQLHGIGARSSSPVDPLEYDAALYQQMQQQPRPPKVHQQRLGGERATTATTTATATATATANTSAKSSKRNSRAKPHGRQANKNKKTKIETPAVAAAGNKGAGQDKGLESHAAHAVPGPAAANLIPRPSQPSRHSTNASNERVSSLSSSTNSRSSRHSSRHLTPLQTDTASAIPNHQAKVTSLHQRQFNETIANPLSSAAHAASQCINPALVTGQNDASSSQSFLHTGQHAVKSVLQTYSKERKVRGNKMDSSQSPTQSNEGRSYEQYLQRGDDLISSPPFRRPTRSSQPDDPFSPVSRRNTGSTALDDDTDPINLDFSALARTDTPKSVPDSLGTRTTTQQHGASPGYVFGNPETPAPTRNPFQGSKASDLMGSSQMFKQTQYTSGVKATFSPTSSRPSPDNIQLNAISPNPSPLKRVALGPSPLQGASSLPQIPLFDTSPQQADEDDTPYDDKMVRSNISKSFRLPPQAPLETYKPVPRWDARKPSPESGSNVYDESDEDLSDEQERRRRRVALKKAQAKRRLEAISFERPSDEAIVPSTNKELSPAAQRYLDQCDGVSRRDSQSSIEDTQAQNQDQEIAIADSQDALVPPPASLEGPPAEEGISSNDVVPNTDPGSTSAPPVAADDEVAAQIPETSPARLRAPEAVMLRSPLPKPISRPSQQSAKGPRAASGPDPGIDANDEEGPSIVVSSSPPAPAFSTRARIRGGKALPRVPPTASSTSPLSRLTVTPALSNKTTPLTEEPPQRLTPTSSLTDEAGSSPAVAKAHRQNNKAVSKQPTNVRTSTHRTTRQSLPSDLSVSTDELARSPPTSTSNLAFEHSTRLSRLGRTSIRESPASRTNSRSGAKIFTGMVFAVSFQGKQPKEKDAQYSARMEVSVQITNKVKQGGGRVLLDGFDQLFEFSPVKNADREAVTVSSTPQPDDDIALASTARQIGFTALIADGHSRKVKYMQALALGLPCIHERWVTSCVEKQRLVDWSDYLLCAGNSSFLGDAIRSRNLQAYDAATAKLSEVIQYRPRLLDQSRILLLMPRAEESKKAYIFLARVLGASLSRVYTVEEARRQLKAREDAGRPFDWVYVVDEKIAAADMFTSTARHQASKKRKRKNERYLGPPAKRVRALSDELVVQSLILGRLMEEEELATDTAS